MENLQILDKEFSLYIPEEAIMDRICTIANDLNILLKNKDIVFVSILNGSFIFSSDLIKHVTVPHEITFIKVASYSGTESTGKVKKIIGLNEYINGRTVVVLEDIIDTGTTIGSVVNQIKEKMPCEIFIVSLLLKREMYNNIVPIHSVGFEIANDFVVGYGLDYNGYGRNLRHIYKICNT